jgi:hypothetical protein
MYRPFAPLGRLITQVRKMYVALNLIIQSYLIFRQGESEHKRSKQFYHRVRKGDHVRGIARHVYRERTLFQAQQGIKKHKNTCSKAATLDIPLDEEEVLGPTPPEDHHHISNDVRHKVNVLKWLFENRKDPALVVCKIACLFYLQIYHCF